MGKIERQQYSRPTSHSHQSAHVLVQFELGWRGGSRVGHVQVTLLAQLVAVVGSRYEQWAGQLLRLQLAAQVVEQLTDRGRPDQELTRLRNCTLKTNSEAPLHVRVAFSTPQHSLPSVVVYVWPSSESDISDTASFCLIIAQLGLTIAAADRL